MIEFTKLIFSEGNPAGIKAALKHLGVCEDYLRLPLVHISKDLSDKIAKELTKLEMN
jgi:4-hydroxy-tetrahydrodipicolinate synthase